MPCARGAFRTCVWVNGTSAQSSRTSKSPKPGPLSGKPWRIPAYCEPAKKEWKINSGHVQTLLDCTNVLSSRWTICGRMRQEGKNRNMAENWSSMNYVLRQIREGCKNEAKTAPAEKWNFYNFATLFSWHRVTLTAKFLSEYQNFSSVPGNNKVAVQPIKRQDDLRSAVSSHHLACSTAQFILPSSLLQLNSSVLHSC